MVGRERKRQPIACNVTVHDDNHRLGTGLDAVAELAQCQRRRCGIAILRARVRREVRSFPRDQDDLDLFVSLRGVHRLLQPAIQACDARRRLGPGERDAAYRALLKVLDVIVEGGLTHSGVLMQGWIGCRYVTSRQDKDNQTL